MMKRHSLITAALLAVLVGTGSGCGRPARMADRDRPGTQAPSSERGSDSTDSHHADHSEMPSMVRLGKSSGKEFDRVFLSEMIEHHVGAVEMSQAVLEHAKRPEVKAAAQKIIAEQNGEVATMTRWLQDWHGAAPDPQFRGLMRADMEGMMAEFRRDCKKDCDRAFLMHMTMHHRMALDMARMAREKAARPELKQFAKQMLNSQTAEMRQFDAWLAAWYKA